MHIECPNCRMATWYPIDRLDEFLTCIGCDHTFPFPVECSPGNEITFEYALNSLANRLMDQDVLPSLLACHVLAGNIEDRPVFAGVELIRCGSTDVVAELDFVFVKDGEICAGECKVSAILQDKDVATARLATELGVAEFHFCTVKEAFDVASVALVDELRAELKEHRHRTKVGILTRRELLGDETGGNGRMNRNTRK